MSLYIYKTYCRCQIYFVFMVFCEPYSIFFSIELTLVSSIFMPLLRMCQPVQEPEQMTQIIVDALKWTGQRGIINKGWGGLGNCTHLSPGFVDCIYKFIFYVSFYGLADTLLIFAVKEPKEFVYLLDNVPHDWLFLHCKAVVSALHQKLTMENGLVL